MRVITKTKFLGTAVALIAVYAAFQVATGNIVKDRKDNHYLLSVTWKPGVLSIQNTVNIVVMVDGYPIHRHRQHVSPWGTTLAAEEGAVVSLTAGTAHPGLGELDCMILKNGKTVERTGFDVIHGPGSVRCQA